MTPAKGRESRKIAAFRARVGTWAARLRVKPARIHVRRMTRKWGSCSTRGRVTFARDLIARDAKSQDFVIVHELLHLRIRTHGKLFRAYLSRYVPGWRKIAAAMACVGGTSRPGR